MPEEIELVDHVCTPLCGGGAQYLGEESIGDVERLRFVPSDAFTSTDEADPPETIPEPEEPAE